MTPPSITKGKRENGKREKRRTNPQNQRSQKRQRRWYGRHQKILTKTFEAKALAKF